MRLNNRVLVGLALTSVLWALHPGDAGADPSIGLPATAPSVTIDPSVNLLDGQSVQVTGSGFSPAAQIAIGECESGATTVSRCSPIGAAIVTADAGGSFSATFVVTRNLTIAGSNVDCANPGACVIGAGELPTLKTFATAPITFANVAPPAPPPPTAGTRYYLALGDSLATGFGVPTGQGYVDRLVAFYRQAVPGLQVVELGCNGETSQTFVNGGKCSYPQGSQLAAAESFLSAHPGQVSLVTIDIGGDDIAGCASSSPPFTISSACVGTAMAAVSTNLTTIGAGLRRAAGPSVPIAGMDYYNPFVIEWLSGPDGQAAAQQSAAILDQVNGVLASSYASFGAPVAQVATAFSSDDFTDLVSSPYGTVPKNVAVACSWLLVVCSQNGPLIVGIHPNATGYGVIASAFEQVVPLAALAPPPPTPPVVQAELAATGIPAAQLSIVGLFLVAVGFIMMRLPSRRRRPPVGGRPPDG